MTRLLVAGTDQVQLPPDSTGRRAGFVKSAIGSAGSEIYLPTSCLVDDAGNTLDSAAASLAIGGTERGLVTRAAGIAFCKVTDGTNTAAVKAASTAPVAADPALVVGLSPNSAGILLDNAGFTDGTSPVNPAGYIFDEVAGTGLTENDVGSARMDSKRAQVLVIEDGTTRGTRAAVKAASTAPVAADPALVVAVSPNSYVRTRQLATYGAGYRNVVATANDTQLAFTFVANTDKQLATIYHAASATKTVRIRKVSIVMTAGGIGVYRFELRRLSATTAPATGNPAITPGAYDTSDGAAEATCLALPTTAGSETAVNTALTYAPSWNSTTTAPTADPSRAGQELVLFDARVEGPGKPLTIRAGVAEGIALVGRGSTATALAFTVFIEFTEE